MPSERGRAVYPDLAARIRQDIISHTWPVGAELRQAMLKQRYGVASERTVQKALELLAAEGLVASQGREPYKVISAEPRQSLETRVDILEEQFRKVRDRLGIVEAKLLGAEEEARERAAGDDRAQDEASRDPEPETETVARRQ